MRAHGRCRAPRRRRVPRGRHAPPLEVRLTVQRRRLFEAAAAVFARVGYAEASAEAIAREAGHVEGDVLRALRQQGGVHPRAVRRGARPRSCARWPTRGRATRPRHLRGARRAPASRAFLETLADLPRRRRRRCSSRSSAPARARPSAATRSSTPSPTALVPRQRSAPRRVRRAALRLARRRLRDRRRHRRARLAPAAHRAARRTSARSSR